MPLIRPSFSALEQFINCERKLFYDKIAKLPQAPSHYLSIGSFYHAAVANELGESSRFLAEVLVSTKEAEPWVCDVTDQALLIEVAGVVDDLRRLVFPYIRPRAVEQWARGKYTAKIDLLSDWTPVVGEDGVAVGHLEEPCIIDWKTCFGRSKPNRGDSQLATYCLSTGAKNAGFCELYRDGSPPRLFMRKFDDYDLRRWETYLDQQFAAMASRGSEEAAYKLAAPDHPLCGPRFCGRWGVCPRGEGGKP